MAKKKPEADNASQETEAPNKRNDYAAALTRLVHATDTADFTQDSDVHYAECLADARKLVTGVAVPAPCASAAVYACVGGVTGCANIHPGGSGPCPSCVNVFRLAEVQALRGVAGAAREMLAKDEKYFKNDPAHLTWLTRDLRLMLVDLDVVRSSFDPLGGERAPASSLSSSASDVGHAPTFEEAWKRKEAEGYQYGHDALEQVRFGWDIRAKYAGLKEASGEAMSQNLTDESIIEWAAAWVPDEPPGQRERFAKALREEIVRNTVDEHADCVADTVTVALERDSLRDRLLLVEAAARALLDVQMSTTDQGLALRAALKTAADGSSASEKK